LVEILKQPQYQPLPMEKQVTILFAGTRGFLDTLPLNTLAEFEQELYSHIEQNKAVIFDTLKEKQIIDADLEAKMKEAIGAFVESFKGARGLK